MLSEHLKYTSNGRIYKITQNDQDTGRRVYKSFIGQKSVDLGSGFFAPYVWDKPSRSIRYGTLSCTFNVDGFQTIREYGSEETLIDEQRFEVQRFHNNKWRVLDLFQVGITVDQQDEQCIITRDLSDGKGNTLDVDFTFKPTEQVRLTFRLHVVAAGLYRINFQNSGIAGDLVEVPFIKKRTQNNLGVYKLIFDNIKFRWNQDEIGIHKGYTVEDQAGGKKLDFFLGDFDLPDDGSVIISPDTFGPTEANDDCFTYGGTYYAEYDDKLGVGEYYNNAQNIGWIWNNVAIEGTANTGCHLDLSGVNVAGNGNENGALRIGEARTATAWGSGNLPEDVSLETASVTWNNSSTGSVESPEIQSLIAARLNNDFVSGDDLCIVWLDPSSDQEFNNCDVDAEEGAGTGARLTIEYTVAGGEDYIKNLLSLIDLNESNKKLMTYKRPVLASIDLKDSNKQAFTFKRMILSTISLFDSIKSKISTTLIEVMLETIGLIESIKNPFIFKRPVFALVSLSDSNKRSFTFNRLLLSTVDFISSNKRAFSFNRGLYDKETINDSNKRSFSLKRFIYDVINSYDSVKSDLTAIGQQFLRILLSVVNVSGSNKSKISTAIKQIVLEAVDIADSLKSTISTALKKILIDSISIIGSLTRKKTFLKSLYGLLEIDDSLKRKITFKRIVLSVVSLVSLPFRKITYKRMLLSGIDLKETLFAKKTILRIIQDSLNIADSVLGKLAVIPAAVVFYKIYQFLFNTVFHRFKVDRTIRKMKRGGQ